MSTPTPPRDSTAPVASPAASSRKSWFTVIKGLVLSLFGLGFVFGVLAWGGFNWSLELTNTEAFCISCHEMKENVYKEYRNTVHYANRTGVRATCPDCHVPKEWGYKMIRKIQASNEVWHKLLGSIDTPRSSTPSGSNSPNTSGPA
jgi:cytochrome c-type protein NapC